MKLAITLVLSLSANTATASIWPPVEHRETPEETRASAAIREAIERKGNEQFEANGGRSYVDYAEFLTRGCGRPVTLVWLQARRDRSGNWLIRDERLHTDGGFACTVTPLERGWSARCTCVTPKGRRVCSFDSP